MSNPVPRRAFIKSAAAASSLLLVQPHIAFGAEANETLQLGVIGCGSRGPWIANFFEQHTNSKCVAVHDYFKDQVDAAGERVSWGGSFFPCAHNTCAIASNRRPSRAIGA